MLLRKNTLFPVSIYSIHEQQEHMSNSPFYKTGVSKSPLLEITDPKAGVKEAKDILKNAKENRRTYRKAKPYKKFESSTEDGKSKWYKEGSEWVESGQYENRSEFKSSMAEENSLVDDARQDLKKARKQYKKNKNT
tara:strand:+ start:697 stop:1104 length:408 start_codon:yes stop_codon:yes gene_type:complete